VVVDAAPITVATVAAASVACALAICLALRRRRWSLSIGAGLLGTSLFWWCYFARLHPIEEAFGSCQMLLDPTYDRTAWEAKFQRYPALRELLDYDDGMQELAEMAAAKARATSTTRTLE
jgi:hypothetical protein